MIFSKQTPSKKKSNTIITTHASWVGASPSYKALSGVGVGWQCKLLIRGTR